MNEIQIPESFYFHGDEIEQFIHVQVPIALIKEKVFRGISDSAKILYGLLLNRTGLSIRNNWRDEHDRTYIIYTVESLCEDLGIGVTKAKKLFSELTNINDTGIGLIKKERILNKPSRIYVLNFMAVFRYIKEIDEENSNSNEDETFGQIDQRLEEKCPESTEIQVGRNCDPRSVVNATHGEPQTRPMDSRECAPRSVANATTNYIEYSNNYLRDNYSNHSIRVESDNSDDVMERMELTRELIKENIAYDALIYCNFTTAEKLDELIEIMVEACVLMGDIEISGVRIPHQLIVSRFEKYDQSMMEDVLISLSENTTNVRNVKKYLLATLYNAPMTMDNHVNLRVQHDMYASLVGDE